MARINSPEHWNKVYSRNPDEQLGWFQSKPETALNLFRKHVDHKAHILEVGAGNSFLSSHLLRLGYQYIDMIDLSEKALERSKSHMDPEQNTANLRWFLSDILYFKPDKKYDLWYDRAVFHFLLEPEKIRKYIDLACENIASEGQIILGCFSDQGPETCSGLPVQRYHPDDINHFFADKFDLIEQFREVHYTPAGKEQEYLWSVMKRK